MTAIATTARTARRAHPAPRLNSVPFLRLVHVEARKLVDTRAGRWLLVVVGVVTAGVIAVMLRTAPPDGLTFRSLVIASSAPQSVMLPILGIVTATSEWSQRTGMVTFTLEPRRARVAAAKLVAAGLVGVVAQLLALVVAALTDGVGQLLFDGAGTWSLSPGELAGTLTAQLIGVAMGVAFGLALQSGPVAIVAFLVLPLAWSFTSMLVSGLHQVAPWLDLMAATVPLTEATMRPLDWAHLGTASLVWLLVPYAVGVLRLHRREVK